MLKESTQIVCQVYTYRMATCVMKKCQILARVWSRKMLLLQQLLSECAMFSF